MLWEFHLDYLVEILNGTYDLKSARKDILSLKNSEYDIRTLPRKALNKNKGKELISFKYIDEKTLELKFNTPYDINEEIYYRYDKLSPYSNI